MLTALPEDPHERALWHLELLGCYDPSDAVAPWLPPPARHFDGSDDEQWDEDPDGDPCTRCGGEGFDQVDDPFWDECDEHGWGPCCACQGTGLRRYQWVF